MRTERELEDIHTYIHTSPSSSLLPPYFPLFLLSLLLFPCLSHFSFSLVILPPFPPLLSSPFYILSLLSHTHTPTFAFSPSLLGPRRKLSIAIAELKEKEEEPHQRAVSSLPSSINRGLGRGGEGEEGVDGGGGYSRSSERGRGRGRGSRPPLNKQPSTELQAAYHQVRVSSLAM